MRFIVLVLDGFGIGAMDDVPQVRPEDIGSNTLGAILKKFPELKLPNLEKLGLMNAFGSESANMKFSPSAVWGRGILTHSGADTFWGHQEIMGTLPKRPKREAFSAVTDKVAAALRGAGHTVRAAVEGKSLLIVDDALTVGDNIEADEGQNYNITADLDAMPFKKVLEIGRLVRGEVEVSRVICFGCPGTGLGNILAAIEEKPPFIGVNAPRSGVYREGYQCVHLGYGVDPAVQVPALLHEKAQALGANIPVVLFGKVADIVENPHGKSVSWVDTDEVLSMTFGAFEALYSTGGFICTNVQETDLAGHAQKTGWYAELLQKADVWIGRLTEALQEGDVLLVAADHGNDPEIGHSHHTREKVPILIASPAANAINATNSQKISPRFVGERVTTSDIGATVCSYFGARAPQNGTPIIYSV